MQKANATRKRLVETGLSEVLRMRHMVQLHTRVLAADGTAALDCLPHPVLSTLQATEAGAQRAEECMTAHGLDAVMTRWRGLRGAMASA